MNQPRRWIGGLSATTVIIIGTATLAAWDRVDKLIESRDAWRDRATHLEEKVGTLERRADDQDNRDLSEDAWRRNSDKQQEWVRETLVMLASRMGLKPPPGPYLEAVPRSVADARRSAGAIDPFRREPAVSVLQGMVP